jgi:hypothetical protein
MKKWIPVTLVLVGALALPSTAVASAKAPAPKHHKVKHKPKPVWWTPPATPTTYSLNQWKAVHTVDLSAMVVTATAMQTPTDLATEKTDFDQIGTEATQLMADLTDLEAGQPKTFLTEGFTELQTAAALDSAGVSNLDLASMNQAQADMTIALDDITQSGLKDA